MIKTVEKIPPKFHALSGRKAIPGNLGIISAIKKNKEKQKTSAKIDLFLSRFDFTNIRNSEFFINFIIKRKKIIKKEKPT